MLSDSVIGLLFTVVSVFKVFLNFLKRSTALLIFPPELRMAGSSLTSVAAVVGAVLGCHRGG